MQIIKPTFIVHKKKAVANIQRMKAKIAVAGNNIRFRPHFKTHQSLGVADWYRQQGISAITVSSVDMAAQFVAAGWSDITIAVLVNRLEIQRINQLTTTASINLLIDSPETAAFLHHTVQQPVGVWLKIDTGYHRTGIEWFLQEDILATAKACVASPKLHFQGLLTHAGHSYHAHSVQQLKEIYHDTITKMSVLRDYLLHNGIPSVEISYGDTPTCSIIETFYGVDEIRCGNFVYNDVQQLFLGSCHAEDIAAVVACPVIAKYPQRNEIVVYGGAVHLSKDVAVAASGQKNFGLVAHPNLNSSSWAPPLKDTYVAALSQEHGVIKTTPQVLQQINVADILMIIPVHSCLAADLLQHNARLAEDE